MVPKRHSVRECEDFNGIKIKQDEDCIVIRYDDLKEFIDRCDELWLKQYKRKHNMEIDLSQIP